jgi:hypothetical protein
MSFGGTNKKSGREIRGKCQRKRKKREKVKRNEKVK